jgi:hypothetical protein
MTPTTSPATKRIAVVYRPVRRDTTFVIGRETATCNIAVSTTVVRLDAIEKRSGSRASDPEPM